MAKFNLVRRRFASASIYCCAVANSDRIGEFEEDIVRPGYSRLKGIALPDKAAITVKVKICKLDTVLRDANRIDIIKLDIEGAELAALHGAEQIIRKFLPALIFECGSEYWLIEQGLDRRKLYEFVTEVLSYDLFTFGDFLYGKEPLAFPEFASVVFTHFKHSTL